MQLRNEIIPEHRERCYVCFRPVTQCFCDAIPSISNSTHLLILQHVKERFHPFNTARIVNHALRNSTLIVDQTPKLACTPLPFQKNTGILYPGPESKLLSDVPACELPDQIVILDGTWHHAKTFMRQIPALRQLPQFRLDPSAPSTYRIRKEPSDKAVSTLEATVQALRILEPETFGTDQLLYAFARMIDPQVEHPRQTGRLRISKRTWCPAANVPTVVMDDLDNVVVAYGEASHGANGVRTKHREPIYWVAQRMGTGETFESAIQPRRPLADGFLSHLELSNADFAEARSPTDFRTEWCSFVRPSDTLAVFNESTVRLLASVDADVLPKVTLKSVNLDLGCSTLDAMLTELKLELPPAKHRGRAGRRLANLIAFSRYLNQLGRSQSTETMADQPADDYPQ